MGGGLVTIVILIMLLVLIATSCIKIVPQAHEFVIELLGKYKTTWSAGFHIKLPLLEKISKKHKVAIVSNKPDQATKLLARELFGGMPAWGESADCQRKPAPDMLYRAMQELGVSKCIYVGDTEVDVLTAKNAGAPCLSVLWGFRDEDYLVENGAEHLCRDPRDLAKTLKELIENG